MADATHKTLSDGVNRWKSINFYWNLVKFILSIVFYIAAFVMFQCSSLFETLSDYFKTTEKAEDTPEKTIETRCDANSFSNQTNKNEELKEVFTFINDTVNELIDKECHFYSNQIDKNEEKKGANKVIDDIVSGSIDNVTKECHFYSNQIDKHEEKKGANKVIGDIVNGSIDNVTKECNGESVFDHNIVAEQKIVNGVIANIVNCKLNKESGSQYYEVEQKDMSQILGESRENSEDHEEKVKKEIITCKNIIGSAKVKKIHPIKNTAMLLITKTMNENKLKNNRVKLESKLDVKFETKLDKDKISNKETPNENSYWDKDNIFTNKSDSFKRENRLLFHDKLEKADCFEAAINSYNEDTSIDSASIYKNDSKNLDIHKNMEPMENQLEINGNEKLITENNVDHWKNDNSNESRNPITMTENMIKEINGEHLKNFNGFENKKPVTTTENMITSNNGDCWDNNSDSIKIRKPISSTDNILNIFEVEDDIFSLPSTFSLAHCICEDFHTSMGMTAEFMFKFGKYGTLMDQNLRVRDVGHIIHNEQHVFYIVIKRKITQRPLLSTLEIALYNLRTKMNDLKLTKLAIPKYGLDTFRMIDVKELISKIFMLSNIEVTICMASSKLEIEHFNPPKVNYTFKQLWEMEKQTDIIIFINMETVYSKNWNDEVVERINAKYPFKERLLKDINIKPMAHGDLLMYKVDTEVLFCVFINFFDQHPSYFRCIEKAFQEMKTHLSGYRYLGVQQEPLTYRPNQHILTPSLALLKSVFSYQTAEIWVCGDTEQHKSHNYQQYKKIVSDAIELTQKRNSKTNFKFKTRSEKKKHSANGNNSKHDLSEKHYSKNISDVNAVTYLNQEQISVDNYKTENWEN